MNIHEEKIPLLLLTIGHGFTHWYPAAFFILLPLLALFWVGIPYLLTGWIKTLVT